MSFVGHLHCGRITIYSSHGLALLAAIHFLVGILDCFRSRPGVMWAQASLMVAWNVFYNVTIGPIGHSCKTSARNVRGKTIAFAMAIQGFVRISMTIAVLYLGQARQGRELFRRVGDMWLDLGLL
ncbi:hypothetical protein EV426DRAFT_587844 [Tirmania nivea]|nr:hypothetical protein EV426DRAFT_587844 [Tirmania nivea]